MPHVISNGSLSLSKFIIDFCLWKDYVSYDNAIIILPLPFSPPSSPLKFIIFKFAFIYVPSNKKKGNVIKNE